MLQPLVLQADQNPLVVMADLRIAQDRRSSPLPEGTFEGLGEVTLSLALANSRAISLFLTDSQTQPWVTTPRL